MKSSVKISIAKPCAENWEQMLPAEQGRHCAACERLIIDFSVKTDQEILEYIKQTNGKLCGRFSNDQLDRDLIRESNTRKISFWEKVAASLLFFISVDKANASDLSVSAQSLTYIESKADTDKLIHRKKEIQNADTLVLKLQITDARTMEGVPFAIVKVNPSNLSFIADSQGNYTMYIPSKLDSVMLSIDYIGYDYKTEIINLRRLNTNLKGTKLYTVESYKVFLNEGLYITGDVIYVEPSKPKWYKFWKNF